MTVETQGRTLVDRVRKILLEPKAEWERIDGEPATVAGLFKGWVLILAAIPAVAGLIGSLVFGYSFLGFTYRPSVAQALGSAITQYVLSVIGVYLLALLIDALAPTFAGTKNQVQAMKVAAYSATASWVAGLFNLIPQLSFLAILGLYSLYLLYLGLPRLMKAPQEKALPYTLAIIVAAVLIALIVGALTAPITGLFVGGPAMPSIEYSGRLG